MMTSTIAEFKRRLRAMISDEERAALFSGGEGLTISAFNRDVMLRLLEDGADGDAEVPEDGVRQLTEELTAYLEEYMPDRPEGHKWIVLACLYLTFAEGLPMHPQTAGGWRKVGERYVCPNRVGDSFICRTCVCESE